MKPIENRGMIGFALRFLGLGSKKPTRRERPSSRRSAVNLTLSEESIRMGRALQAQLNRPSLSNVVEHLLATASKEAV